MDGLPLRRDGNGEIQLAGTGAVTLRIVYDSVLGTGRHGVVFKGEILGRYDSRVIMKVSYNPFRKTESAARRRRESP